MFAIPAGLIYLFVLVFYSGDDLKIQNSNTTYNNNICAGQLLSGGVARSKPMRTPQGITFRVNTPLNYQAEHAYPLIVVYAPAMIGSMSERFTGLTNIATRNGFITAYVDSQPLSLQTIPKLGEVVEEIKRQWCIDEQRIFFTGHSDGGTVSQALVFLKNSTVKPKAIAPSAAGLRYEDLQTYSCPTPTSILLMHNKNDSHFPDYGKSAIKWWAECNQCNAEPVLKDDGCEHYLNCAADREGQPVEVLYCEGEGGHLSWPKRNERLMEFLLRN